MNRWTILACLTGGLWLAMSIGACVVLLWGTTWAMATIVYEAVTM